MSSTGSPVLGDSWVISDEEDELLEDEEVTSEQKSRSRRPPVSKISKANQVSPEAESLTSHTEPELIMPSLRMSSGSSFQPRATKPDPTYRKRKVQETSQPSPQRLSPASRVAQSTNKRTERQTEDFDLMAMLSPVMRWMFDIVFGALKLLKQPLILIVAAWFLVGMIVIIQNLLTSSIYNALSPLCRIPGVSFLHLPICRSPYDPNLPAISAGSDATPEFDQLMTVQSNFESILEESASGVTLPLDMKRSESSIRDLRQIVRFSTLSSRNELVLEFDGFIETARLASYDLQKFNSHVGRGVDIVLSTARWTQRVLDDINDQRSTRGLIPAFIQDTLLAPFQPLRFTESRLLDQYIQHTRVVSLEIQTLIDEAQALLLVLQNLEDRLDVIHSISMRDNIAAQSSKDEILTQLWTLLGGNRQKLGKYNNQLKLLRDVGQYRKIAWAHVSGTILKLQAMGAELEELRTRVGSAEVLRDSVGGREVPLSVHIESIRLGVERLEVGRERAREVERRHVRRVVDGSEARVLEGEGSGRLLVGD